jgi:hypothetical protein
MRKISSVLLKLYGVVVGALFGLFLGLIVIGTIGRVALDAVFHYGDSGPSWITVAIVSCTLISVIVCIRVSMSWVRIRLAKDTSPGRPMRNDDSANVKNG